MRISLLLALALTLTLAGCADSQTASPEATETAVATEPTEERTVTGMDQEALDRVVEAAANSVDAGTARFSLSVEAAESGATEGAEATIAEGEEDFAQRLRLIRFVGGSGELATVVDDTTVYVELPATEGDDWARVELDELLDDAGFGGPGGLPFQSSADNLKVLENAVVAAAEEGSEDLDGTATTRYHLNIDLEQAAEDTDGEVNETFSTLAESSSVDELDMTVWIDDEDLIRRVSYAVDLAQAEEVEVATEDAEVNVEPTGQASVTVDYFDYGATLDIEVPDEASIVDIDEEEIKDSFEQQ